MPVTAFPSPLNNASTSLRAAYTAGSGTMTLATGYGATIRAKLTALGLPSVSATAPLRYTVASSAAINAYGMIINPTLSAIYQATDLTDDTLTGVSVVEGSTDQNFAAGDAWFCADTAGTRVLEQSAIQALEQGIPTATGTFIVQTASADLPNAQDLASLATGLLKSTTATGIVSIAVAGTDYLTPTGNGSGLTNLTAANIAAGTAGIDITGNAATAVNVTGTVAIAHGGTGQTTAAAGFNTLSPLTTLGDILYASGANTAARLAGNTSTTKKFLTDTGDGVNSAAPAWGTIASTDLPPQAVQNVTLNTGGVIFTTPVTFSVATGTATGALTLNTQAKNTALLGPTTGADAAPTFRAIAAADILTALGAGTSGGTTWCLGSGAGDNGTVKATANATGGNLFLNGSIVRVDATGNLGLGATIAGAGNVRLSQSVGAFYRNNANNGDCRFFELGKFSGSALADAITFGGGNTSAISMQAAGQLALFASVTIGTGTLTTASTSGFGYLSNVAGTPTGVPTAYAGYTPILVDTAANKLWIYNGGWKSVTFA